MPRAKKDQIEKQESPRIRYYREKLARSCDERVELDRRRREIDARIVDVCVKARSEGVTTAQLASMVTILDRDGKKCRTVTRQAIEQMIKAHRGSTNGSAPQEQEAEPSVDLSVFQ